MVFLWAHYLLTNTLWMILDPSWQILYMKTSTNSKKFKIERRWKYQIIFFNWLKNLMIGNLLWTNKEWHLTNFNELNLMDLITWNMCMFFWIIWALSWILVYLVLLELNSCWIKEKKHILFIQKSIKSGKTI